MKRQLRLRSLMLMVVAAAVLPTALLVLTLAWAEFRDTEQRELQTLTGFARLSADEHARLFKGTQKVLLTLAQGPALRDPALHALCTDYLTRVADHLPSYTALTLIDPDGRVRCSSAGRPGLYLGDRAYFAAAMGGEPFVYGGLLVGRQTGRDALAFAVPVRDGVGIGAVLVAGLDARALHDGRAPSAVPGWLRLHLFDDAGGLVAQLSGPVHETQREAVVPPALRKHLVRGDTQATTEDANGVRRWHAMQPLPAGDQQLWVVASAMPQRLLAPLLRRMAWQLGGLALVMLGAGALAWFVGTRWVTGPAEQLRLRIRQRMTGEAAPPGSERTAPQHSRELAEIDAAFRALDQSLEDRELRLQAQLHRLQLLQRITRAAGERLDTASIEAVVVGHVEQHLPADACAFAAVDPERGVLVLGTCGDLAARLLPTAGLVGRAALDVGVNGLSRCLRGELVCENDLGHRDEPLARQLAGAGVASLALAPLPGADGGVTGVLLAARHDEPLQSGDCEFLGQLAQHVALATRHAALYAQLQQSFDDLRNAQQRMLEQERLRAIGQMAAGIAHDINNALAPALLQADAMLDRDGELDAPAVHRLVTIRRGIEDVAATVARLRELYRPASTDGFRSLDANELLRQVADLTRARWHDQAQRDGVDIRLQLELADALPPLPALRTELRDALVNLVFNAVDAMPAGGTLTLASEPAVLADGRPALRLSVRDSGAGMDEATRQRCLEPFFSTKGERGSGLGLPMVALAAQRHAGRLDIASEPGHGSRFALLLPLQQPASTPAPPRPVPVAVRLAPLQLLVVDDDAAVRQALTELLRADGHEVTEASTGRQALAALRDALQRGQRPDAVLTDLGMPDIDGRELALAIKALAPTLPVLMITGWGRGLDGDALPAGVDAMLAKPLRLHELRQALLQACPPTDAPPEPA